MLYIIIIIITVPEAPLLLITKKESEHDVLLQLGVTIKEVVSPLDVIVANGKSRVI